MLILWLHHRYHRVVKPSLGLYHRNPKGDQEKSIVIEHMLEHYHKGCRVMKLVTGLYYGSLKVVDLVLRPHYIKSSIFVSHLLVCCTKKTNAS